MHTNDLSPVATGLDRPESVTYGPDGLLYAGGWEGQIYRIHPAAGTLEQIADIGGTVLGLCLDADLNIYACNVRSGTVMKVSAQGQVTEWSTGTNGIRYTVPNYCAFGPDGFLWLTDSGEENPGVPTGRLIRIPVEGGEGEVVDTRPLDFPNGLCVDADGAVVFLESFGHGISRYRDGQVDDLVKLTDVTPDGIAMDADGGILVACYYPFRLLYVPAHGADAEVLLDDPVGITLKMPANVAYYGAGLERIAVSALAGDTILGLAAPRPGLPLYYPSTAVVK